MKDLVLIGGPNGAGKTTLAAQVLPRELGIREFVNADNIAAGLSPYNPEATAVPAARIMLDRMRALITAGTSFAIETTCAGSGHARTIALCQRAGWRVTLIFIYLDSPDIAVARVARRVSEGGHAIPAAVIHRRYWSGLRHLMAIYLPLTDGARIYDNSLGNSILVAHKTPDGGILIHDPQRWNRLRDRADEAHQRHDLR